MSELAELEDLPLDWRCREPGLRAGIDSEVDALLSLRTAAMLRESGLVAPAVAGSSTSAQVVGLCDVRIEIEVPNGIGIEALSRLEACGPGWRLPDLSWHDDLFLALSLSIPGRLKPPVNHMMRLARVRVTASLRLADGATASRVVVEAPMGLPVLSDDEFSETPCDEGAAAAIARVQGREPAVLRTGADPAA